MQTQTIEYTHGSSRLYWTHFQGGFHQVFQCHKSPYCIREYKSYLCIKKKVFYCPKEHMCAKGGMCDIKFSSWYFGCSPNSSKKTRWMATVFLDKWPYSKLPYTWNFHCGIMLISDARAIIWQYFDIFSKWYRT